VPTVIPTDTPPPVLATPTPVTPPGNADKIAFLSRNQLYLMNVDGTGLFQVRTDNSAKSNLQWIPDGRLVYVSRNCVFVLDAETVQSQEIVCFNSNELLEGFRVSPDGEHVAISIQRTLNIVPLDYEVLKDATSRFNLLAMEGSCFYNQYSFRDVLWSDDGTQIAARVVDTELVNSDQIFLLNVDIPNCTNVGPLRVDRIPGIHFGFVKESTKRITSYDWDGNHLFLLNDTIRNDGFGNLYLYNNETQQKAIINPVEGECCYRDARWSPDGKYLFFVYQRFDSSETAFYYSPYADLQNGQSSSPIELPNGILTQREKPQPVLRPAR
jgi:Tol biopolymer transport system component